MKLWVLRHGEAHHRAPTDAERELTERGRAQVRGSAAGMSGTPLQAIFASPYVRAQQTAALAREVLGFGRPVTTVPWLTPDSDPHEVIEQLDKLGLDEALLVSHQPLVSALVGMLEQDTTAGARHMDTASLAELEGYVLLSGMTLLSLRHAQ